MKVYLHIGLHKTGTTAIQRFLTKNTEVLAQRGWLYPRTGRRQEAHYALGAALWGDGRPEDLWVKLREELDASAATHALISSENLEYIREPEQFATIAGCLRGCEIVIIAYLRRQDDFLASSYAQAVKARRLTCDIEAFFEQTQHRYDYAALLDRWAHAFGRQHIRVRPYEREQLPNGLIADFRAVLGLEDDAGFIQVPGTPNTSLDDDGVQAMRAINEQVLDDAQRLARLRELCRNNPKPAYASHRLLAPARRRALIAQYASANAAVARTYLDRPDGRLFHAPEPEDGR